MTESTIDHTCHVQRNEMTLPPRVDFQNIARNALNGGIFTPDRNAIKRNRGIGSRYLKFPTHLLHAPYGNGPLAILLSEQDVPVENMSAVRRNFTKAIDLLAPTDQILLYFHQRFHEGSALDTEYLAEIVKNFDPLFIRAISKEKNSEPEQSSQAEGVNRKVYDSKLYTQNELKDGVQLALDEPEVLLSILLYQSVLHDYFQELKTQLYTLALLSQKPMTLENSSLYDDYAKQWVSSNFTDTFLPAIALFLKKRMESDGFNSKSQLFDASLFQDAFQFVIANGAFRHWVKVPAHVANDGKERTNHFLCPATKAVKEQMQDGVLLSRIYSIVKSATTHGDVISSHIDTLRNSVISAMEFKQSTDLRREEFEQFLEARKTVAIHHQDGEFKLIIDDQLSDSLRGKKRKGDTVLDILGGSFMYDAMQKAIQLALTDNISVFFSFNDKKFRITPEQALKAVNELGVKVEK